MFFTNLLKNLESNTEITQKEFPDDGKRMVGAPRGKIVCQKSPFGIFYHLEIPGHHFNPPTEMRAAKFKKNGKWYVTQDFQYLDDLYTGKITGGFPFGEEKKLKYPKDYTVDWATKYDRVKPVPWVNNEDNTNNPTIDIALPAGAKK